eukprot:CAMPEP_0174745678 /NCGR_PEP_ID=MMETSP1094-20130205/87343_1 /TAXON_ID=156173 /ORGANISM="Chrysochromulina brevifilum, Strain UTEX LB 985" /LENGTH=39 /DNA_ID= /DNA_START= /DNA_END= /DNA_ORIENTATION=
MCAPLSEALAWLPKVVVADEGAGHNEAVVEHPREALHAR